MSASDRAPDPDILFITRKWAPAIGGMETWSMRLSDALGRRQPVQTVYLPGEPGGMPPSTVRLLLFPLTVMKIWFFRRTPPAILQIGDMALWPVALLSILAKGKTRAFIAAHGTDVSYHRRRGFKGRLFYWYLRTGSKLLSRTTIIANSRATSEVLAETGWQKVRVVPLATDMVVEAKTGERPRNVLFAGRLVERKGCAWFANEVLPLLPPNIRLQVAGTAWDDAEKTVLENPRVDYLGSLSQSDLKIAYAAAICVIVPNIAVGSGEFEGFGLVAPEAASCGAVVLAADRDGLRDAVLDGKTGILLPSGNADRWADAIRDVATWTNEERSNFVAQSTKMASEFFNWDRVAQDYLSIYFGDEGSGERGPAAR